MRGRNVRSGEGDGASLTRDCGGVVARPSTGTRVAVAPIRRRPIYNVDLNPGRHRCPSSRIGCRRWGSRCRPRAIPPATTCRCMRVGNLLFVAGQLTRRDGVLEFVGKVGRDFDVAARPEGRGAVRAQHPRAGEGGVRRRPRPHRALRAVDGARELHALVRRAAAGGQRGVRPDGRGARRRVAVTCARRSAPRRCPAARRARSNRRSRCAHERARARCPAVSGANTADAPRVTYADVAAAAKRLRGRRASHPGADFAPVRRAHRRHGVLQVREPAAHGGVQVPRRVQRAVAASTPRRARAASSRSRRATTRRRSRSPGGCSAFRPSS